jgi:hypothetical protein
MLHAQFKFYFSLSNVTSAVKDATMKSHRRFILMTTVCCKNLHGVHDARTQIRYAAFFKSVS